MKILNKKYVVTVHEPIQNHRLDIDLKTKLIRIIARELGIPAVYVNIDINNEQATLTKISISSVDLEEVNEYTDILARMDIQKELQNEQK